ncbi:ROK family transcriptional regulator [Cohaesibacter celericrescens]|uniref:ROK family transcriptional regulator n=1 Tax=Cohaesibacter celericrescens TaxID=2067669 RepID=UPI003566E58F
MSKAPSNIDRISDPSGGANQTRVRAYNERLVLSLVRRHGHLPKSDIARRSGLSAQTVSVIMRSLEADGLLLRREPVRGKVGQPSIPMALNPEGAYSFGMKIGRRSAEMVLINFLGNRIASIRKTYPYPLPHDLLAFAIDAIKELSAKIDKKDLPKIAGIGIGIPFQLWMWAEKVGAPHGSMDLWQGFDISKELEEKTGLHSFTQNDATAACGAELTFGRGAEFADFVYFFIGTFAGGGIVLNHSIYSGRTGNAGALGSLPIKEHGSTGQLLDHASIYDLEKMLIKEGKDPAILRDTLSDWSELGDTLPQWIECASDYIAMAIVASSSVIDFEAAIIDGAIPRNILEILIQKTIAKTDKLDLQGIILPTILPGTVGNGARALGAATLPLFNRYLLDQNVLFKAMG